MASQAFVEYHGSAPEVIEESQHAKLEAGPAYHPEHPSLFASESPKKRILGLAPRTAYIIIALIALLAVIGIVVGAVLGTRHNNHSAPATTTETPAQITSPTPSRTTSSSSSITPSFTESAIAASTPTALTVVQAIYGSKDVTDKARPAMQQGRNLVVDMSNTDPWGSPDPWVGRYKCLSLLHSYGSNTIRTFVACEGDGEFTLTPENATPSSHTQDITRQDPCSSDFAIVSVVWGNVEIRQESVYKTLCEFRGNGSAVPFGNDVFVTDMMIGQAKSGVIWFTDDDFSTVKSIYAWEGETAFFR